jgi:hypothetical protein
MDRKATRPPVESVTQTAIKVTTSLVAIVVAAWAAWHFHASCADSWVEAFGKTIGVEILIWTAMCAVAWPFSYWASMAEQRGQNPKISKAIAENVWPWSTAGMAMMPVVVALMVLVFTRECRK